MRRGPVGWAMLADGEFDVTVADDGVEVWVTQMGDYMNMNTAFIDRVAGIVAIVDLSLIHI